MENPEQTTNGYSLPSGTVSFLFTDIEGSTKLAQDFPAALPYLLARHAEILNSSIHQNNGVVFQIIGDGFCAAFHTASDALNAAVGAQHKLHQEAWDPSPIRVRMGIHTGTAHLRNLDDLSGGYAGYLTLARAQRVMSAAYGGQVLLSNSVAELLGDNPFADVTLQDLGEHYLKGLANPERLWQAQIAGLPQDFPPIQSLHFIQGNLPVQLTSFIGRVRELAELKERMVTTRLLTLTGVGGTGKTRLALQLAGELLEIYKNGAWTVELAPLSDPDLIPAMVASSLGVREDPGRPILEMLLDYLRPKQLLLILDNCEHLIEASARFADQALHACPGLSILATSREALSIAGEHIHPVPSLELPNPDKAASGDEIARIESVRLFVDRVTDIQSHFTLTGENAEVVIQICRRLDGIPLAIELAAARVKSMSVQMVADYLDDRFRLLTGGSRSALPRQQTLRAAIDWSYNLLSESERRLLRCLSIFVGGCTLEAARAIYNDGFDSIEVLQLLSSLVDKSLLILDDQGTDTRYTLLETIRQYAREKLLDSEEMDTLRRRHLEYFSEWAEVAEPETRGPEQAQWLRRLEVELDNIRLALEFGLGKDPSAGMRLASSLWWFWLAKNHTVEGVRWLESYLQQRENRAPTIHRGRALSRFGFLDAMSSGAGGKHPAQLSLGWVEEGLEICCSVNNIRGQGYAHFYMGWIAYQKTKDYTSAKIHFETALKLFEEIRDIWGLARVVFNIGNMARNQGDKGAAIVNIEKSLALCREIGDLRGIAISLDNLGMLVAEKWGDLQGGRDLVEEALDIYRQNELHLMENALLVLANLLSWQGEYLLTNKVLNELLEIANQSGNPITIAEAYLQIGYHDCLQDKIEAGVLNLEQNLRSIKRYPRDGFSLELANGLAYLGDIEQAKKLLEDNRDLLKEEFYLASTLMRIHGFLSLLEGKIEEASHFYRESLNYAKKDDDILSVLLALEGYAWALNLDEKHTDAARLLAAAGEFRKRIGAKVFPRDQATYDQVIANLINRLGAEAYEQAVVEGKVMGFDQVITIVLRGSIEQLSMESQGDDLAFEEENEQTD